MSENTVFDKILAHEIPAHVVYEDDWVLAFKDINPQAKVHVLVIPKRKAKNFTELASHGPSEVGEYVSRIAKVVEHLGLKDRGYRVVFNCGRDGGQTVDYVHAHILGGQPLHMEMA